MKFCLIQRTIFKKFWEVQDRERSLFFQLLASCCFSTVATSSHQQKRLIPTLARILR